MLPVGNFSLYLYSSLNLQLLESCDYRRRVTFGLAFPFLFFGVKIVGHPCLWLGEKHILKQDPYRSRHHKVSIRESTRISEKS